MRLFIAIYFLGLMRATEISFIFFNFDLLLLENTLKYIYLIEFKYIFILLMRDHNRTLHLRTVKYALYIIVNDKINVPE